MVAIFDIATDRVAAALVAPNATNQCVNFSTTTMLDLPYQEELNPERLLSAATKALGEVAQKLVAANQPKPKSFHCFLASPFYAPQTRISHLNKEKDFTVNRAVLRDLANQERARFLQSVGDPDGTKGKLIDELVMQVKLNRYVTKKPEHQTAREVEIATFLSWGEAAVIDKLNEAVKPVFHRQNLIFHSSTVAMYQTFRLLFPNTPAALILQLGGEITELSLIHSGILLETVSYPLGFNFLLRELGTRLGLTPAAALSLIKLGQKEGMREAEQQKFNETMEELRFKWLAIFSELLHALAEKHFLANRLFVLGDERFLGLFSTWLKNKSFAEVGILKKSLGVEPLTAKLHEGFCEIKENQDFPDELLLMDALFCARILE